MNPEELRSRLERYNGFLQQDAGNISLTGEVADLHLQLGEFAQARDLLEKALARSPSHPALVSRLGNVAMASSEPDLAIRLFSSLLESGQNDPTLRYNLAYAYMYARQYENAKQELLKIIDGTESPPQTQLLLARAHHYLGETADALKHAQTYIDKFPDDADAMGTVALLNLDSENLDAARSAAEKALASSEDNLNALITLGSLSLNTQDTDKARGYFEKAVERHPQSGRSWSGMGLTDMMRLDLDKAIVDLTLAVKYMPDHIGTWHALAWCQLLKDDLAGAEISFNNSMEIDHSFGETHGGLAVIYVIQSRAAEAESAIKRAMRLNRNSFAGRFAQSLLVNKTDPEKAKQMIQAILASSPTPDGKSLQDMLRQMMPNQKPPGK